MRQDGPDAPAVVEHAELRATIQVEKTVAISPATMEALSALSDLPPRHYQVATEQHEARNVQMPDGTVWRIIERVRR